ncbi:MAG: amidohydrolase family protein [Alphaproteobacteria bacterium]|jgi:aminocarboxymuconate-semialdehyde decarboxylase|nr:amidohydrolase family protein [Alphaproteobacteria bacterium]
MIIDVHAHFLPEAGLEALARQRRAFPSVELREEAEGAYRLAFAGRPPTRPIMAKLRDSEPRLGFLAEQGIDLQLAGGWLDAFGYEIPAEEGADWSRFLNQGMIEAAAGIDALRPLATVPMQDGRLAAAVLEEAVAAGCPGAMIGTQPKGGHGNLDDPDLDPFWERAAALGVPIMIHPMFGSDDGRLADLGMMNAVGRVTDVTIAISRLLFSGHLLRFQGLKVIASTGGGALPYMLGRLARNHAIQGGDVADPVEGFHRLYFDSIVFREEALRFLVDMVGADRVMLGSDYPFPIGDMAPRRVIENSGYGEAEVARMLSGTAAEIFAL